MSNSSLIEIRAVDGLVCYSGAEVRAFDARMINDHGVPGIVLMKRAGRALWLLAQSRFQAQSLRIYCGRGNNAGDGYILAGIARGQGVPVELLQLGAASALTGDAAIARDWAADQGVVAQVFSADQDRADLAALSAADSTAPAPLIVDALLGTGLSTPVRPEFAAAINCINARAGGDSVDGLGSQVLSVDVPSGLCATTGAALGSVVRATATLTFIGCKRGLLTGAGPEFSGACWLDELGAVARAFAPLAEGPFVGPIRLAGWRRNAASSSAAVANLDGGASQGASDADGGGTFLPRPLPPRRRDAHKGSSGHVLIIGGNRGMGGATALAADAAMRVGAGLVSVGCHPDHLTALTSRRPELMARGLVDPGRDLAPLIARASVIILGPGLGTDDWSRACLQAAHGADLPSVVDADALNLVAELGGQWLPTHCVITPHPGEAARLLDLPSNAVIQADRFAALAGLARRYQRVAVLKGAGSLICAADGSRRWLCPDGNPGMGVAGMGDLLSGVVGALMAQGDTPARAAVRGVAMHARAGDIAASAGERGLLASDLLGPLRSLANGIQN